MKAAVVAVLLCAAAVRAAEVPQQLALVVMLKVLTYDASFSSRGDGDFVVLVPWAPGHREQAEALTALGAGLSLRTINSRSLRFVAVPLAELTAAKGAAVLFHPGFDADAARSVLEVGHLYTMAFDEALVREGVMLGVGSNDGRPQVLVNVAASRKLGVELASAVLKVARAIQ